MTTEKGKQMPLLGLLSLCLISFALVKRDLEQVGREMVYWLREPVLCKCEFWVWIPSPHEEARHSQCAHNTSTRGKDRCIPRAHPSGSLAKMVTFWFSERLCLKSVRHSDKVRHPTSTPDSASMWTSRYIFMYTHMHTSHTQYIHTKKKRKQAKERQSVPMF